MYLCACVDRGGAESALERLLRQNKSSSRVLKARLGGCCLKEPRGEKECVLETRRQGSFVRYSLVILLFVVS